MDSSQMRAVLVRVFVVGVFWSMSQPVIRAQVVIEDTIVTLKMAHFANIVGDTNLVVATGSSKDTTTALTGISSSMLHGLGSRVGVHNYSRTREGTITAIYNNLGSDSDENIVGVLNRMDTIGGGSKTGVYSVIRDDNDNSVSSLPIHSVSTIIDNYSNRNSYGSQIEIDRGPSGSIEATYGYHITYTGYTPGDGAREYGVYSRVPGEKNLAGYFGGNVVVTGSLTETSDARLKRNGKKIKNALTIVSKLKPRSYRFKRNNRFDFDAGIQHYGFLAHQVKSVLPAIVHDIKHPDVPEHIDDGEAVDRKKTKRTSRSNSTRGGKKRRLSHQGSQLQGVRYMDLLAVLVGAVQDQQDHIKKIKQKLREKTGGSISNANLLERMRRLRERFATINRTQVDLENQLHIQKACSTCNN